MISFKKILIGLIAGGILVSESFAQTAYFEDALRFSQFRSSGSARITAIGGVQMSLGGDISNIHGNPAGLGFFRRSEFSISPSFSAWNSASVHLGQNQDDRTGNFSVPNLGVVLSKVRDPLQSGSFRGGAFGISFSRLANFNNQFGFFSKTTSNSSLLDFYVTQYNNFGEPPLGALDGLPLDIMLIQGSAVDGYFKDPDYVLGDPLQDELIIREGGLNQTTFAYGANFDNKLFFGGALGIISVNYLQNRIFNENFYDDNGVQSLYYSIEDNIRTNGIGLNLDLGVIYKPIDQINLGLNFKTPTWYRLNQENDANIIAELFDQNGDLEFDEYEESDLYINTANLSTPMILNGGLTYFIGKNGFISADVDFVDYSKNRLNSQDYNTNSDNQDIRAFYGSTINYRVGGELRLNIWRIRAGYAYYGDPIVNSEFDRSTQQISGGVGVKLRNFYVDFALSNSSFDQRYNSYPIIESNGQNSGPITDINNSLTQGMITFGINF